MKTLYKILVPLVMMTMLQFGYAQSNSTSGAIAVENGIFIYAGSELPKSGYYLYERKGEKDRQYKEIAKTTVPNSEAEVEKRAVETATYFRHLVSLNKKDVKRVYQYLQSQKMDDSLYRGEQTPIISIAAGTGFLDTNVEKDKNYQYKATYFKDGNEVFQREIKAVKNTVVTNLPIPKKLNSEVVNQAVFLEWIVDDQKEMAFFNTYRAYFGTLDFKKINVKTGYSNEENGLQLIAVDSTTEQSSLYKYYIQAVDLYGNAGEPSEIITSGKLQAESIMPISSINTEELSDYQIKLSWKLHPSAIRSNIQIWRSANYDNGFVEVTNLPPNTSEFIDILPKASENYYYYLVINGGSDQEFKSAKIAAMVKTNNTELPAPQHIFGKAIKDGVELSWRYDQPYTRGFYVYRSTATSDTFNQVSNLIPVDGNSNFSYQDLSKNLQAVEMYRYTIRAENDTYVLGKVSDTIHVIPGKKLPIATPQKLRAIVRDSLVDVVWGDMTQSSETVLGYKVYRSNGQNSPMQWMRNDTLQSQQNYYSDKDISKGQTYTYQVAAIDIFGQESALSSDATIVIPKDSEKSFTPSKPSAFKNSKGITISWDQVASESISDIKIYRSDGVKDAKVIKTVSVNNENYLDTSVKNGELYYYKISFISKNGKESEVSREVSITF